MECGKYVGINLTVVTCMETSCHVSLKGSLTRAIFSFWQMWTFVTGILVHIRQKKITLEIPSYTMFLPTFCCPSKQSIDLRMRVVNWKMVNLASSPVLITEPHLMRRKQEGKPTWGYWSVSNTNDSPTICRCKDFWLKFVSFLCLLSIAKSWTPFHNIS